MRHIRFLGMLQSLKRLTPTLFVSMLKCIKNLSMDSSTLESLQKAGAIRVLTEILGTKDHVTVCIVFKAISPSEDFDFIILTLWICPIFIGGSQPSFKYHFQPLPHRPPAARRSGPRWRRPTSDASCSDQFAAKATCASNFV